MKLLNRFNLISVLIGAVAALVALGGCTKSPQMPNAATAPSRTHSQAEHIQIKLGSVEPFSNVTLDAQYSPEGNADALASPMAALAHSILKFCNPNEGPVQGAFTLDHGRKDEPGSANSSGLTRCFLRNLEDTKFPDLSAKVRVVFQIAGDGPLAPRK